MTRTEERNLMISTLKERIENKDGQDMIYDFTYETYFTYDQAIRTIDIIYEILGDRFETLGAAYLSDETVEISYELAKESVERMYKENLISKEVYDKALINIAATMEFHV